MANTILGVPEAIHSAGRDAGLNWDETPDALRSSLQDSLLQVDWPPDQYPAIYLDRRVWNRWEEMAAAALGASNLVSRADLPPDQLADRTALLSRALPPPRLRIVARVVAALREAGVAESGFGTFQHRLETEHGFEHGSIADAEPFDATELTSLRSTMPRGLSFGDVNAAISRLEGWIRSNFDHVWGLSPVQASWLADVIRGEFVPIKGVQPDKIPLANALDLYALARQELETCAPEDRVDARKLQRWVLSLSGFRIRYDCNYEADPTPSRLSVYPSDAALVSALLGDHAPSHATEWEQALVRAERRRALTTALQECLRVLAPLGHADLDRQWPALLSTFEATLGDPFSVLDETAYAFKAWTALLGEHPRKTLDEAVQAEVRSRALTALQSGSVGGPNPSPLSEVRPLYVLIALAVLRSQSALPDDFDVRALRTIWPEIKWTDHMSIGHRG